MYRFKDSLFVGAEPAEPGVSDDMVAGDKAQVPGVYRFVHVVGKHPVIILVEEEERRLPSVQIELAVAEDSFVAGLCPDRFLAGGEGCFVQAVGPVFSWDNQFIGRYLVPDEMDIHIFRQLFTQLVFFEGGERKGIAERLAFPVSYGNIQLLQCFQEIGALFWVMK